MATKKTQKIKSNPKISKPNPSEFLETMKRIKMIAEEIKAETQLYDVKMKSLELEKEYLLNKINPKRITK